MDRRTFLTVTSVTAVGAGAGCLGTADDGETILSTELDNGESDSFEASSTNEYEVTAIPIEGRAQFEIQPEQSISVSPMIRETIDDESTFDLDVDNSGPHEIACLGGGIEITITERS